MQEMITSDDTLPPETEKRKLPTDKKRRQFIKPKELIAVIVFIAIVGILLNVLIGDITLKRDTNAAQAISTKVVTAINKRDGQAIWNLGSPQLQHQYTPASLTQGFQAVEIATLKMPTLIQQTVVDTPNGRNVYFIYAYTALKVPFYIQTEIEHRANHWYLNSINGNADESQLTVG